MEILFRLSIFVEWYKMYLCDMNCVDNSLFECADL